MSSDTERVFYKERVNLSSDTETNDLLEKNVGA